MCTLLSVLLPPSSISKSPVVIQRSSFLQPVVFTSSSFKHLQVSCGNSALFFPAPCCLCFFLLQASQVFLLSCTLLSLLLTPSSISKSPVVIQLCSFLHPVVFTSCSFKHLKSFFFPAPCRFYFFLLQASQVFLLSCTLLSLPLPPSSISKSPVVIQLCSFLHPVVFTSSSFKHLQVSCGNSALFFPAPCCVYFLLLQASPSLLW